MLIGKNENEKEILCQQSETLAENPNELRCSRGEPGEQGDPFSGKIPEEWLQCLHENMGEQGISIPVKNRNKSSSCFEKY